MTSIERPVHLAEEPVFHVLGNVAEVDVHVLHLAGIDALAGLGIGLIRQPQMNAAGHGQRAIQLRPGGSAGEDADLKFLTAQVGVSDAARQRHRHGLGIAGAGESAHADLVPKFDQRRSFVGAHDAVCQAGIQLERCQAIEVTMNGIPY